MMIEYVASGSITRKQADAFEAEARAVAAALGLTPDDVADTVRFMAAPNGGWTHGERTVWCWVVNRTARALLRKAGSGN